MASNQSSSNDAVNTGNRMEDEIDEVLDEDVYDYNRHKSDTGRSYVWEKRFTIDNLLDQDAYSQEERLLQLYQIRIQEERKKRARVALNRNDLNTIQSLSQKSGTLEQIAIATTPGAVAPNIESSHTVSIIRKGIIRYMFLIVDTSSSVRKPLEYGIRTSRIDIVQHTCTEFVKEYFDQNPLSQMGLIVTRDAQAFACSDLSGSVNRVLKSLGEQFKDKNLVGEASLQNALTLALNSLRQIPMYGSKEVLIVYSSLSTCDPGNIFETINELKENNIRCSIVSLDAEMHILKTIAKETGGVLSVALNVENFKECMFDFASPPPATTKQTKAVIPSLIRMGFPQKKPANYISICACHNEIRSGGYICPQCKSKYCELPVECKLCSLTLVSSPHLARSYHHLFPVKPFVELNDETFKYISDPALKDLGSKDDIRCFACMKHLPKQSALRLLCLQCTKIFCIECDLFIHNDIHNCPGCDLY